MPVQPDLFANRTPDGRLTADEFVESVRDLTFRGRKTELGELHCSGASIPTLRNEFWTSRQRAAHSLHEISYRACFKPQLPEFFVSRLTGANDTVYDPFMGRGTTIIQAALMGRIPRGCDVNPLSRILTLPRLAPPRLDAIESRLNAVDVSWKGDLNEELLVFYHPETLKEIHALRSYLLERSEAGVLDQVDDWIRMVAVNRLTGHSPGFFSVYTLPPNQAPRVDAQRKINSDRGSVPPRRDVKALIVAKSRSLLDDVEPLTRQTLTQVGRRGRFEMNSAETQFWEAGEVDLVITSPPFLDVVDYATDNWLRCWFCGIESSQLEIATLKRLDDWKAFIGSVFIQLARLLKAGGFVAFEVGEVRGGKLRLEEAVVPCGLAAGLQPICIMFNEQRFTKTANIWGVSNNAKGTNSNRIVVFQRR